MPYIHLQPDWPDFAWDMARLAPTLAEVRHAQGRLLGAMQSLGFAPRSEANLSTITSDVVKTSEIEGEMLNPREVRSSVARRLGLDTAGLPRPGREVEGVVEMMLDATQNYQAPLTAARLFAWHTSLFPGRHAMTIGAWRTDERGPMQVVSGPMGSERIHFEAPAAERLEPEMAAFLGWFNTPLAIDPVIKAGVAHFWFVTIHPFDDGNGRIARAIADLCLARADNSKDRYYSMSTQIRAERPDYYKRLESASLGTMDISGWLEWFLQCLGRAIASAEVSISQVLARTRSWQRINEHPVNERQRAVISRLMDGFKGHLTTSKYALIAKCSQDTALRDIRELVEWGVLAQNPGRGRGTSYRLAGPPK
jgi:Fic family protein